MALKALILFMDRAITQEGILTRFLR